MVLQEVTPVASQPGSELSRWQHLHQASIHLAASKSGGYEFACFVISQLGRESQFAADQATVLMLLFDRLARTSPISDQYVALCLIQLMDDLGLQTSFPVDHSGQPIAWRDQYQPDHDAVTDNIFAQSLATKLLGWWAEYVSGG